MICWKDFNNVWIFQNRFWYQVYVTWKGSRVREWLLQRNHYTSKLFLIEKIGCVLYFCCTEVLQRFSLRSWGFFHIKWNHDQGHPQAWNNHFRASRLQSHSYWKGLLRCASINEIMNSLTVNSYSTHFLIRNKLLIIFIPIFFFFCFYHHCFKKLISFNFFLIKLSILLHYDMVFSKKYLKLQT